MNLLGEVEGRKINLVLPNENTMYDGIIVGEQGKGRATYIVNDKVVDVNLRLLMMIVLFKEQLLYCKVETIDCLDGIRIEDSFNPHRIRMVG